MRTLQSQSVPQKVDEEQPWLYVKLVLGPVYPETHRNTTVSGYLNASPFP